MEYWLSKSVISQSSNMLYRAWVFNFQEDLWNYIYSARSFNTEAFCCVNKEFEKTLILNYNQFQKHLNDSSNISIIDDHVTLVKTRMELLLDAFNGEIDNLFYKAVLKVHDEFAI